MRIHFFQHLSFETPGTISDWAMANNHETSYTCFFANDFVLPDVHDIDALVVMGGAMNTDEEEKYPWLRSEKKFIRETAAAGKKIIGICLGAQLIADALGARVYKNKEKEIGFFPVYFTCNALSHPLFNHFANPYTVFHWHGDTFELPVDSALIASTPACTNQVYLINNVIAGFQFHFELNKEILKAILVYEGAELEEKGDYIQSEETIYQAADILVQNKKDFILFLQKFFC